jgi:cyclophilin family peptidyl-prolyl cis-trans isomerase
MKNMYKYLSYLFILISIILLIGIVSELSSTDSKDTTNVQKIDVSIVEGIQETQDDIQNPIVLIKTSLGDITVELDTQNAPITTENFLSYINDGFYENLVFHRVISEFMIQGGGFNENQVQKETKSPIILESYNGLSNTRGTIAMARTNNPASATSQFFINTVDNAFLDSQSPQSPGYAVFGKVTQGMEIVDTIRAVETTTKGPHQDWPVEEVIIYSIELIK